MDSWPAELPVQFSSVIQSCPSICDPMDCSISGFSVWYQLLEPAQTHVFIELVMTSNHLILCHLLFLLPSVFPRIKVFSNESALPIRWPKYWSFSFSISPSNEYLRLISFRNPQGIWVWKPVGFDYRTFTGLGNRLLEGTNQTLCAPGPRRKEQWPHKRLSQTCLWVSWSSQWRCGSTVACHGVGALNTTALA